MFSRDLTESILHWLCLELFFFHHKHYDSQIQWTNTLLSLELKKMVKNFLLESKSWVRDGVSHWVFRQCQQVEIYRWSHNPLAVKREYFLEINIQSFITYIEKEWEQFAYIGKRGCNPQVASYSSSPFVCNNEEEQLDKIYQIRKLFVSAWKP